MASTIVIVHLRRPRLNDPNDSRRDPFWEFGSFGLTGCHSKNILHPNNLDALINCRLAFVQGGDGVMKLVYLTPPIDLLSHADKIEARWEPAKPFNFFHAPLVVDSRGVTMFPKLKKTFSAVKRDSWPRKFSSMYRSRRTPLPLATGKELGARFDSIYAVAKSGELAHDYEQALPFLPRKIDRDRLRTYKELLSRARGSNLIVL